MRAINFLIIFAVCLALVLFSLQNTQSVNVKFVENFDLQAPLCIELIAAMGVGAVGAWFFSIWTRFGRMLQMREENRQKQKKDERIKALEQDVERYKAEIEQNQLLQVSDTVTSEVLEAEVLPEQTVIQSREATGQQQPISS